MRLRDKLADNEAAIRAHLNAVNEVATLMQNAIQHAENGRHLFGRRIRVGAVIKFIAAAIWICAVTIGAVFYSFQSASAKLDAPAPPPLLGGLDYVKTEIVSVPVLKDAQHRRLFPDPSGLHGRAGEDGEAVGAGRVADRRSGLFLYLRQSRARLRQTTRRSISTLSATASARSINKRVGEDLIQEVLIEQVDFLSKEEIRDNTIRRKLQAGSTARAMAKGFKEQPPPKSH